jgi:hypothetical protein
VISRCHRSHAGHADGGRHDELESELVEGCERLARERLVGFAERLIEHERCEARPPVGASVGQVVAERRGQAEGHKFFLLSAGYGCGVPVGVHRGAVEVFLAPVESESEADIQDGLAPASGFWVIGGETRHEIADPRELGEGILPASPRFRGTLVEIVHDMPELLRRIELLGGAGDLQVRLVVELHPPQPDVDHFSLDLMSVVASSIFR